MKSFGWLVGLEYLGTGSSTGSIIINGGFLLWASYLAATWGRVVGDGDGWRWMEVEGRVAGT